MKSQDDKIHIHIKRPKHYFMRMMLVIYLLLFIVPSILGMLIMLRASVEREAATAEKQTALPYASLHQAVAARDLYAVLDYIDAGEVLDVLNEERLTPYLLAVREGAPHIATALHAAGASARTLAPGGNNAAHLAAAANRVYTLDTLCLQYTAPLLQRNRDQYLATHTAAERGHTEIARVLAQHGMRMDLPLHRETYSAPLRLAAENKRWDTVAYLRAVGGDYGLDYAIEFEDIRTIRTLLDSNPFLLEQGDVNDLRPLHVAICLGRKEPFMLLLAYGADISVRAHSGKDALDYAVQFNRPEMAENLITKGGTPNALSSARTGFRRLHLAAREAPAVMVSWLVAQGAELEAQDAAGHTALYLAVHAQRTDVVQVLLDAGASVSPEILQAAHAQNDAAIITLLKNASQN